MQIFPFSRKEIRFFKELNRHRIPYIIVGSASAALQGAPIATKDVGIWFEDISGKKVQKVIHDCGAIFVPSVELNPPSLAGKGFDLLDIVIYVHGIDSFKKEYKRCLKTRVAGVSLRLLPLDRIIKSKKYLRRKKDIVTLPVLKDTLAVRKIVKPAAG